MCLIEEQKGFCIHSFLLTLQGRSLSWQRCPFPCAVTQFKAAQDTQLRFMLSWWQDKLTSARDWDSRLKLACIWLPRETSFCSSAAGVDMTCVTFIHCYTILTPKFHSYFVLNALEYRLHLLKSKNSDFLFVFLFLFVLIIYKIVLIQGETKQIKR